MIALVVLAAAIAAAVLTEVFVPCRPLYQMGWYNVALIAAAVLLVWQTRGAFRRFGARRGRIGVVLVATGALLCAFGGVVCGLLAPQPQTIIGAPGEQVRSGDLGGSVVFPLTERGGALQSPVLFRTQGGSPVAIGNARYLGSFALRTFMRDVVYVDASDARDAHLTITQPTGSAFLSPVLLMQHRQQIRDMDLPFDAFSVPAAHRVVHSVLFTAQQVSQFRGFSGDEQPAVLFEVESDAGKTEGITLAPSGVATTVGGLRLTAYVIAYPAVEAIAIPSLVTVILGMLALLCGAGFMVAGARRGLTQAANAG